MTHESTAAHAALASQFTVAPVQPRSKPLSRPSFERRDRGALGCTTAPGVLDADADPDSRTPDHVTPGQAAILDAQRGRRQIQAVVLQRDGQRPRQVAGAPAQLRGRKIPGTPRGSPGAAAAHDRLPVERFERPDQHCGGRAFRLGDRVHQTVNAVIQIDVGEPGWSVAAVRCGRSIQGRRDRRDRTRRCRPRFRR